VNKESRGNGSADPSDVILLLKEVEYGGGGGGGSKSGAKIV
jgi:hypothetical protein